MTIFVKGFGDVRIVTGCLFANGEASNLQGQILLGTDEMGLRLRVTGRQTLYKHSLDHQDYTIENSDRAFRGGGGVCPNCCVHRVRLSVKE